MLDGVEGDASQASRGGVTQAVGRVAVSGFMSRQGHDRDGKGEEHHENVGEKIQKERLLSRV